MFAETRRNSSSKPEMVDENKWLYSWHFTDWIIETFIIMAQPRGRSISLISNGFSIYL